MRLLLATGNAGKVNELAMALQARPVEPVSLVSYPDLSPVVEDGATFLANAAKKACQVCRATGETVLADDSGLLVDALAGAPGIHSARFAGPGAGDAANNALLLERLREVPPAGRQARFYAVLALATPDGRIFTLDGTCDGLILPEPRGEGGFGYDPLFYLPEYGKTMAELSPELKNRISHRGRAMAWLVQLLDWLLEETEQGLG
ncbi:MAG TPA: XTP/dITP diphosphatase [Spirochaetia bacterium]|nr:XTP/dITP diphosphatase [Spirochaetia bacterium]